VETKSEPAGIRTQQSSPARPCLRDSSQHGFVCEGTGKVVNDVSRIEVDRYCILERSSFNGLNVCR